MRDDYEVLHAQLGLSDDDIKELGLWLPAVGTPDQLAEAYLRRSKKREDVAALRGHLRDMVKRAQELGVGIRRVWFEQLSASKRSVDRREYKSALDAVHAGESKTFIVWKLDRFDRRGAGSVLSAVDELDTRKARLVTCVEHVDSSQKGARLFIAIYAEQARSEAEDIALRVRNGHVMHKAEGRRGTGKPPFGTESPSGSGVIRPNPAEFAVARFIADGMLAGKGSRAVASKANELGYRTRNGATWSHNAVTKLVQSPLFAGLVPVRERRLDEHGNPLDSWRGMGDPLMNAEGKPVTCGTGVITPAEFYRIKALIHNRTNPFSGKGKREGTYLLSPILRCGRCGGHMHGGGGKYHCSARTTRGTSVCAGVTTTSDRIERVVSEMWLQRVNALEPDSDELYEIGRLWLRFRDPETELAARGVADALSSAEGRLAELHDRYWNPPAGAYRLPHEQYEIQAAKLTKTVDDLKATAKGLSADADVSALLDNETLTEAWAAEDVSTRRTLLRAVWPNGIRVMPATRRGDPTPIHERLVPNPR